MCAYVKRTYGIFWISAKCETKKKSGNCFSCFGYVKCVPTYLTSYRNAENRAALLLFSE